MSPPGVSAVRRTGLLDLPPELLQLICASFCRHCLRCNVLVWKPSIEFPSYAEERVTLRSLVQTSRLLRRISQPTLWHAIHVESGPGQYLRERLFSLLRLLKVRRDLRAELKAIVVCGVEESSSSLLAEIMDDANLEERALLRKITKETGLPLLMGSFDGERLIETLTEVLISMLPALSEIHLQFPTKWSFENLAAWRYKGTDLGGQPRPFLAKVRRMELELEHGGHDQCGPGHDECNRPTPNTTVEQVLIEAAPNLNMLACSAGGLNNVPHLARLKALQLQLRGTWDKLPQVIESLPGLTHLKYWSYNEHCPTPREVEEALAPRRETLELLNICMQRFLTRGQGFFDEWEPPRDRNYVIKSLQDFTNLKSLTIDTSMIWRYEGLGEGRIISPKDKNKIASLFPEGLEVLFVDEVNGKVGPVYPLAETVAAGRYRNLKGVFWYIEGWQEECFMDLERRFERDWLREEHWQRVAPKHCSFGQGHDLAFPDWVELYRRAQGPEK